MVTVTEKRYSDATPEGVEFEGILPEDYSLLEHELLGSTPPFVRGIRLNPRSMMEDARKSPKTRSRLLTPIRLMEGTSRAKPRKREEVARHREVEKTTFSKIGGHITVLTEEQMDLQEMGIYVRLAPASLAPESNEIVPEWQLQAVDGRRNVIDFASNPDIYSKMQVKSEFADQFSIALKPDVGFVLQYNV